MIETANYNKSMAKGEMVPTITLGKVQPNDWLVNIFVMKLINFILAIGL